MTWAILTLPLLLVRFSKVSGFSHHLSSYYFAQGDSDLDTGDSSLHYHYTHSSFSNLPPFVPFAAPYIGHHETHK